MEMFDNKKVPPHVTISSQANIEQVCHVCLVLLLLLALRGRSSGGGLLLLLPVGIGVYALSSAYGIFL